MHHNYGFKKCRNCNKKRRIWVKKQQLCKPCYEHGRNISSIKYMNKKRFGGNRKKVLKKSNYSCKNCGMTNAEHQKKWNRDLTINHIDRKGRNAVKKNHDISNLEVLCLSCHSKKDSLYYWHVIRRSVR